MRSNVLPRTDLELSTIGISSTGRGRLDTGQWKSTVAHARKAGVNLFDLTGIPPDREAYLRQFLEESGEPLAIIVGRSAARLLEERSTPSRDLRLTDEDELAQLLERSVTANGTKNLRTMRLLVEWQPTLSDPTVDRLASRALRRLVRDEMIQAWGTRPAGPPTETAPTAEDPDFESRSVSLLERPWPASERWRGFPLLARDPLAAGRLDGSRLDASGSLLSPGQRPVPVAAIREEFAPVLRLGPLTRRGQRTLLQVALRYVIDVVGAISALVPAPDARRLDEILAFESSPPLSAEDVELIASLPRSPPPFDQSPPFSPLPG